VLVVAFTVELDLSKVKLILVQLLPCLASIFEFKVKTIRIFLLWKYVNKNLVKRRNVTENEYTFIDPILGMNDVKFDV
jgi:hypothetical protein